MAAILDFWRASWIDNGYFLILYSIQGNDHLNIFWCFYNKVNERHVFAPIDWTTLSEYLVPYSVFLFLPIHRNFWLSMIHRMRIIFDILALLTFYLLFIYFFCIIMIMYKILFFFVSA